MSTDKCPHCGLGVWQVIELRTDYWCGSSFAHGKVFRSNLCNVFEGAVRAARQNAEAELAEAIIARNAAFAKERQAEENLDTCRKVLGVRVEELAETRRKLEEAADLIAKLKPFLRHNHPRCVTLCECGLNKVIMDAGRQADVVKADAAAKKGGGV